MTYHDDDPRAPVEAPQVPPPPRQRRSPRRRMPSLFWPIVLIVSGILLLLSNLGYLPAPSWNMLLRLWPVLLIAMGVDVLIGRRSVAGAVASGILILILLGGVVALVFFARSIPFAVEWDQPEHQVEHVEYPLGDLDEAEVVVDWRNFDGKLEALEEGDDLIEVNVDYYGEELFFDVDEQGDRAWVRLDTGPSVRVGLILESEERGDWQVALHPDVAYELDLDSGGGTMLYDLEGMTVTDLKLDSGSGEVELRLPRSSFDGTIDVGSGELILRLPEGVGLRVERDGGSGAFVAGPRLTLVEGDEDDGIWETEGYAGADHRIELDVDQGSGRLTIR